MPTALLLSPDDQAVSAISAVLEEMSVTCERPLDGVSAAQKLHSHTFDLVLVDCDNLPAAKLIFDVCRRGKGNNNPVPIAIVDGRAGLPTAFRLGAELILTKPVAKDQARSTIRTAVSRIKKEEIQTSQVNPNETNAVSPVGGLKNQDSPVPLAGPETSARKMSDNTMPQGLSLAAAAGVKSPLSASVPAVLGSLVSPDAASPVEAESEPTGAQKSGNLIPAKLLKVEGEMKAQRPVLSFDSRAQGKQSQSAKGATKQDLSKQDHNQNDQSEQEEKKQSRLVALLVLLTAVAGLYASWMYEPGFRALAQPLIERALAITGIEHQLQHSLPAPSPAKPAAQPKSVPADPAASAQSPGLAKPSPSAAAMTAPITSLGAPAAPPLAGGDKTGATQNNVNESVSSQSNASQSNASQSSQTRPGGNATDAKQTAGKPSDAELPGEATAVVLSSKGAENRLVHSEQPTYPAGAASHPKGPMVLKAVVDENGKVAGARVIQGDSALASSAISAVKQWRYRPYIHDGKAEPFQTVVVVDFQQP